MVRGAICISHHFFVYLQCMEKKNIDWGGVVLYGLTALCFMAIGALIGLWTLIV